MTRAHVRLLGPCFKTGQVDCLLHNHRLSMPIAEAAANRHVPVIPAKGSEASYEPERDNVRAQRASISHSCQRLAYIPNEWL